MIKIPSMLMVGATGRNAGKTEFACLLIKKFGPRHKVTAIKVTAINESGGGCPHGQDGCGVCPSFKGNFSITEETNSRPNKDTSRMLAAGAARVFWLRVLKARLKEGISALLEDIGNDQIVICESNSLRTVVEPGLFFIVASAKGGIRKPSAGEVMGLADDVITYDGNQFGIDINQIEVVDNKWVLKMNATAIIMAGGESRRMGEDKSMLPVEGKPMIQYILEQLGPHFRQVLISSNDAAKYAYPGVKVIPDEVCGKGPLMGIASSLRASANQANFVIACDIPTINVDFIRRLLRQSEGYDAVVPQTGQGRYEPLFAVYKKSVLPAIDKALTAGVYRVIEALKDCNVRYIDMADAAPLKNLNTMDEYSEFTAKTENAAV